MVEIKSEKSHARLDGATRRRKAQKIISLLDKFTDLSKCNVIDIGTGSGHIAHDISKVCRSAVSVDLHDERVVKAGYSFKKINDEKLPFKDSTFDVVISNHVLEHIPDQKLHVREIYRILKKNGLLYLATPNKYWFVDPHYKLPFLTWFPRHFSSILMKLIKNQKWDIYSLSYNQLAKLLQQKFEITNVTFEVIKRPEKYHLDNFKLLQPIIKIAPNSLLKLFNFIMPTYILVLRKK